MRFLGELSQARNDGVDLERASETWSTSSFTSCHGQYSRWPLAGRAVGGPDRIPIEIERAIKRDERPLLLKSCRVRLGPLEALGPGSHGVLISGH